MMSTRVSGTVRRGTTSNRIVDSALRCLQAPDRTTSTLLHALASQTKGALDQARKSTLVLQLTEKPVEGTCEGYYVPSDSTYHALAS